MAKLLRVYQNNVATYVEIWLGMLIIPSFGGWELFFFFFKLQRKPWYVYIKSMLKNQKQEAHFHISNDI